MTTNPKSFTITDAEVQAQQVTSFIVAAGLASGGPYTAATATVAVSALTVSGGVYTGTWSELSFTPALTPGTVYFMTVEAVNAVGPSGPGPEQQVELLAAPSPPTGFTVT